MRPLAASLGKTCRLSWLVLAAAGCDPARQPPSLARSRSPTASASTHADTVRTTPTGSPFPAGPFPNFANAEHLTEESLRVCTANWDGGDSDPSTGGRAFVVASDYGVIIDAGFELHHAVGELATTGIDHDDAYWAPPFLSAAEGLPVEIPFELEPASPLREVGLIYTLSDEQFVWHARANPAREEFRIDPPELVAGTTAVSGSCTRRRIPLVGRDRSVNLTCSGRDRGQAIDLRVVSGRVAHLRYAFGMNEGWEGELPFRPVAHLGRWVHVPAFVGVAEDNGKPRLYPEFHRVSFKVDGLKLSFVTYPLPRGDTLPTGMCSRLPPP